MLKTIGGFLLLCLTWLVVGAFVDLLFSNEILATITSLSFIGFMVWGLIKVSTNVLTGKNKENN